MVGQSIRSTFPLDGDLVKDRAKRAVWHSSVTWIPVLGVTAAYCVFDVHWLPSLISAAVVAVFLIVYWKARWLGVLKQAQLDLISEHNRAQNKKLQEAVVELQRGGFPDLGITLSRFLHLKEKIESRIHETPQLTHEEEQVETTVDSLCFGVLDQLRKQAEIGQELASSRVRDSARRERLETTLKEIVDQIDEALATLQETWDNLDVILGPGLTGSESPGSLDSLIMSLGKQAEIARRVELQIKSEFGES